MKLENKFLVGKSETLDLLKTIDSDIVLTMGAGDIEGMAVEIIETLKNN